MSDHEDSSYEPLQDQGVPEPPPPDFNLSECCQDAVRLDAEIKEATKLIGKLKKMRSDNFSKIHGYLHHKNINRVNLSSGGFFSIKESVRTIKPSPLEVLQELDADMAAKVMQKVAEGTQKKKTPTVRITNARGSRNEQEI